MKMYAKGLTLNDKTMKLRRIRYPMMSPLLLTNLCFINKDVNQSGIQ